MRPDKTILEWNHSCMNCLVLASDQSDGVYGKESLRNRVMNSDHFRNKFVNKLQVINVHIPKTAGTTFRSHVVAVLPVMPFDPSAEADSENLGYFEGFKRRLKVAEPQLLHKYDYFASGHFRFRDLQDAVPQVCARASIVTFLRHPVRRMLSDYYYSISSVHPGANDFHEQFPSFVDYLHAPGQANKQIDYLKPHNDATLNETINSVLENFSFVGITEQFEKCEGWFFDHIGRHRPRLEFLNRNINQKQVIDEGERYIDEIKDVLSEEIKLYNFFDEMWNN